MATKRTPSKPSSSSEPLSFAAFADRFYRGKSIDKAVFWHRGEDHTDDEIRSWATPKLADEAVVELYGFAAGLRARDGSLTSARGFLAAAEARAKRWKPSWNEPKERKHWGKNYAGQVAEWTAAAKQTCAEALIIARGRLNNADAERAFVKLVEERRKACDDEADFRANAAGELLAIAGRAGLWKQVDPFAAAGLERVRVLAWAIEAGQAGKAVAKQLVETDRPDVADLAWALRDDPARYLELLLAAQVERDFGELVEYELRGRVWWMLHRLETSDAGRAADLALKILSVQNHSALLPYPLAIVATHAPAKAKRWAESYCDGALTSKQRTEWATHAALLVALGREADVGKLGMKACSDLDGAAVVSTDRAFAREALKAHAEHVTPRDVAARLVASGEGAWVDALLEKQHANVAKRPAKEVMARETLAYVDGQLAQVDRGLALAPACTSTRRYSIYQAVLDGCASVGDWSGAWQVIERTPAGIAWKPRLAIERGACLFADGAHAVPLRSALRDEVR